MARILVIAECLNINSTSEGICTSNFLNALAESKHNVECVYYQFVQHEIQSPFWISDKITLIKIPNTPIDFIIQYARKIRYLYLKILGRSMLRDRRSYRLKKYIAKLLKTNHYDLVFVRTIAGSIASHQAVLELSRKYSFKWIAYFNDPVPISMMPFPYFKGVDNFKKETHKTEQLVNEIVKTCSGIASPSLLLTRHILKFLHINAFDINVYEFPHIFIPCNLEHKSKLLDKSKMNFLHAGTILEERDPTYLLSAFNNLLEKCPKYTSQMNLIFIGSVHEKFIDAIDGSKFKDNIILINRRIKRDEIISIISEADVLLIIEAASIESPFMPGKLADYIGLNKTIFALSPERSETRRILGLDYPYQCEPNDENRIQSIIQVLFTRWNSGTNLKLNAPSLQEYVSSEHVRSEIEKIIVTN
jgi:glycosyltransferase involved in cell wall biosynthesis